MQAEELHQHEEQEEDHRQARLQEVLPGVPEPYAPQGGEGLGARRRAAVPACRVSSSNGQSTGIQIRGVQGRILPDPLRGTMEALGSLKQPVTRSRQLLD